MYVTWAHKYFALRTCLLSNCSMVFEISTYKSTVYLYLLLAGTAMSLVLHHAGEGVTTAGTADPTSWGAGGTSCSWGLGHNQLWRIIKSWSRCHLLLDGMVF